MRPSLPNQHETALGAKTPKSAVRLRPWENGLVQSISERRLSPREAEGSQMFPRQTKSTTTGRAGEVVSVLAITRCTGVQVLVEKRWD